jgi:hypothetical protein
LSRKYLANDRSTINKEKQPTMIKTENGKFSHLEKPLESGVGFLYLAQNKQMRVIPCFYRKAIIMFMGVFGMEDWEGREVKVKTKDGMMVDVEEVENEIRA